MRINNLRFQNDIRERLDYLIHSSAIIRREKGANFYEYNGIITIDIPGVNNEFVGTETEVSMPRSFVRGFDPVGGFHTHLYNDMPSTTDIKTLIEDIDEDIRNRRTIFPPYMMSIGGASGNIKSYVPKFLYGIRSLDELLRELNGDMTREVIHANEHLKRCWDYWITRDPKKFYEENDIYVSLIIEKYFYTFDGLM